MPTLKQALENGKLVPYSDILTGKITENSFAAGFHAVLAGKADKIYNDPDTYFTVTHLTKNIKNIFGDVLIRVSKGGARPLLIIDTTFGGGKTHTLIGLYHLFKTPDIAKQRDAIRSMLTEIGISDIPEISLVAIDAHNISSVKRDGRPRTIWGEIGKQLGCYDLVKSYDQELRKPDADTLSKMIDSTNKPVLIMIDELVNHLKDSQAEKVGDTNLAEITVSFFHTMTDVIVSSRNAMFIITLPGGEPTYKKESEMLDEYKKKIKDLGSREAAFTVPMEKSEMYEIVKKRLFEYVDETYARQVAEELQQFYISHSDDFPEDVVQPAYYEKIKKSYPFHPSVIDLLYERISSINEFQKTRGVLRLLSHVVRDVYANIGSINEDITITPGLINLNDHSIFQELTNKVARGEYQNVIKTDIVNDDSDAKCQKLDNKYNYGSYVRISTSIYLYTLIGTAKEVSIGCSRKELVLATAVNKLLYPKDIFDEIKALDAELWYIYEKGGKWHFSVDANLNRVISDETDHVTKLEYDREIKTRIGKMLEVTDYFDVRVWEHDVRSPHKPTLVVVNYNVISASESEVPGEVREVIDKEGTTFRTKKNLMFVLVPRRERVLKMVDAAKRYIAIKDLKSSIKTRAELKAYSGKMSELSKESESNLNAAIELCYSLIYYPYRTGVEYITVQNGYSGAKNIPDKIYLALSEKAKKIIKSLAPVYIAERILKSKKEITVREVYSDFEESPAHPLPESKNVINKSILDGVDNKLFGMYTGGVGDILSITESNYMSVGSNFYYNRMPSFEPKDAYYIIPKDRAEEIEDKLNSLAREDTSGGESGGADKLKPEEHGGGGATNVDVVIDDITEIGEYKEWSIQNMGFNFSDQRIFSQLQTKLGLILLGVTGVKHSVSVKSKNLNLSISETEVSDLNALMDVLSKISTMFSDELNVNINLSFRDDFRIDDDIVDIINQLNPLRNELIFSSKLSNEVG